MMHGRAVLQQAVKKQGHTNQATMLIAAWRFYRQTLQVIAPSLATSLDPQCSSIMTSPSECLHSIWTTSNQQPHQSGKHAALEDGELLSNNISCRHEHHETLCF